MRRFLGGLSLLLWGYCGSVVAASAIDIQLSQKATVTGPAITLGEIAQIDSDDRAAVEKLRRVKLSTAAPAGRTVKLTTGFIKVVLRKEGYALEGFSFSGVEATEVLTQSQLFSVTGLLPDIKRFLQGQLK